MIAHHFSEYFGLVPELRRFADLLKVNLGRVIANVHIVRVLQVGEITDLVYLALVEIEFLPEVILGEEMVFLQALSLLPQRRVEEIGDLSGGEQHWRTFSDQTRKERVPQGIVI